MRIGFFLKEALRALRRSAAPSFAAMLTILITALVLGVFIPVVQATTGTANEVRGRVVVATHDREMVDKMRRRVIELNQGRLIRDQAGGMYQDDESTSEFAVRLRGELGIGDEGFPN